LEKPDHRQHAPVIIAGLRETQLYEDASDVLLDSRLSDPQLLRDTAVRSPLRHQRQDLALTSGEILERIFGATSGNQLPDQNRIDNRRAVDDPPQRRMNSSTPVTRLLSK
jgi:hypothetical protein